MHELLCMAFASVGKKMCIVLVFYIFQSGGGGGTEAEVQEEEVVEANCM